MDQLSDFQDHLAAKPSPLDPPDINKLREEAKKATDDKDEVFSKLEKDQNFLEPLQRDIKALMGEIKKIEKLEPYISVRSKYGIELMGLLEEYRKNLEDGNAVLPYCLKEVEDGKRLLEQCISEEVRAQKNIEDRIEKEFPGIDKRLDELHRESERLRGEKSNLTKNCSAAVNDFARPGQSKGYYEEKLLDRNSDIIKLGKKQGYLSGELQRLLAHSDKFHNDRILESKRFIALPEKAKDFNINSPDNICNNPPGFFYEACDNQDVSRVDLEDLGLRSPPENLPASLKLRYVGHNQLTSQPAETVPVSWPEAEPQPPQDTLKQQQLSAADIEKLRTFLSNLEAVTNQQAAAPQPADLNQIMDFMKIHFADAIDRQQCDKEVLELTKKYPPNTVQGARLLYNLIYMTLITLHQASPHNIAAPKNSPSPYTSDKAVIGKMANQGLSLIPIVGPALAVLGDIVINTLDHKDTGKQLLLGLVDIASINGEDTLPQQKSNMQKITHALAYRLALNFCQDEPSMEDTIRGTDKKVRPWPRKGSQKHATLMDYAESGRAEQSQTRQRTENEIESKAISDFTGYTGKIRDEIMKPGRTRFENVEQAVASLLTASLRPSRMEVLSSPYSDPKELAKQLGDAHEEIINSIRARPESNSVPPGEPVDLSGLSLQEGALIQPQISQSEQASIPIEEQLRIMQEQMRQMQEVNRQMQEVNRKLAAKVNMLERTQLPPDVNSDGPLVVVQDEMTSRPAQGHVQQNVINEMRLNDHAEKIDQLQEAVGIKQRKQPDPPSSALKEKLFRQNEFY